jgi:hypothetical protein
VAKLVNVQKTSAVEVAGPLVAPKLEAPPNVIRAPGLPRARSIGGTKLIARMLRSGAVAAGGMFVTSLLLEALPQSQEVSIAIDLLRKGGASVLIATPVLRLVIAGGTLGLRGEWKYAAIAAAIIGLLGIAVGAGVAA